MNRRTLHYDGETLIETTYRDVGWKSFRVVRDQALDNSDWRFMSDQNPTAEWVSYRLFLRELPQNFPGDNANDACDAWNEYEKPEGA